MACASFLSYWLDTVPRGVLMAIILASLVIVNFLAVKAFGEIEYWLAMIKIVAIIFFLGVSVFVLFRDKPGSSRYDEAGGPFLGKSPGEATISIIGMISLVFTIQRLSHWLAFPLVALNL